MPRIQKKKEKSTKVSSQTSLQDDAVRERLFSNFKRLSELAQWMDRNTRKLLQHKILLASITFTAVTAAGVTYHLVRNRNKSFDV